MNEKFKNNNALYDHRIFYPTLANDNKLKGILKWLSGVPAYSLMMHNGSFDADPAILSLEEHRRRAERLSKIVPKVSELGIIPAINVLQTMGHGNKKSLIKEKFGFQPIVGSDGVEVEGAVCALDENFLGYVYQMYRIYAQTGALHIWADDDVRITHHGEGSEFGCFCPIHMQKISDATSQNWEREKIVKSLSNLKNRELWEKWYKINSEAIVNLFKQVEKAVHGVNPNIRIGMMICGHNSTRDVNEEIRTPRGNGAALLLRPGGGYWDDGSLLGALRKRILIRSEMPMHETEFNTSYELENHPYWPSLKSIKAMELEMDLNFAEGIDRIALNIFDNVGGPIDEQGNYKKLLCSKHRFHTEIKKCIEGKKGVGIYIFRSMDSQLNIGFHQLFENFARGGMPISDLETSPAVLYGRICETLDNSKLISTLNKGAIIDGTALKVLIKRKILDKDDINILGEIDSRDIGFERFTDNSINGEYKGEPQQVWGISNPVKVEIRSEKKYSVLSEWIGVNGNIISPALIMYNSLNPCLIFPYNISGISFLTKRRSYQIGCFLGKIPEYEGVWVKKLNCYPILWKGDKEIVLAIANFSLDPVKNLTIWLSPKLGKPKDKVQILEDSGEWERTEFLFKKTSTMNTGICLEIKASVKPMAITLFKNS